MSVGITTKNYPDGIDSFATWEDDIDTIVAVCVNDVQDQVIAIETALGTNPQGSVADLKTRLAVTLNNDGTIKNATIVNDMISGSAAIALSKLADVVVKADGTQVLTGHWNVGDKKIVGINAIGIGTTDPLSLLHVNGYARLGIGTTVNEFSTDGTLDGNSDDAVPTEKAVKTYVASIPGSGVWTRNSGSGFLYPTTITDKIGIGTTDPQAILHIEGDLVGKADGTSNLGSSTRRWVNIYTASNIDYSSDLNFNSSGTKVIFKTDGKVGVGTTNPLSLFHVNGYARLGIGTQVNEFSTDGTLGGNSDDAIPTEKAVKTYADNSELYSIVTKSSGGSYTPTLTDDVIEITQNANFTINLPAVATSGWLGKFLYIKKLTTSSYTVTIDPDGTETVDGLTTLVMVRLYECVMIVNNGTSWDIIPLILPPVPHATISDSTIQTVASTSVEYPVLLDTNDVLLGLTHDIVGTAVTIDIATPAVIHWTGHNLHVGSPVQFSTSGALPTGITAGTVYYVITAGFGADAFEISTTPGGAAVNTSGTQSGTHLARSTSKITLIEGGTYSIGISIIVDSTTNTLVNIDVWVKINGTNLTRSNTQISLSSSGVNSTLVVPFTVDFVKGDYFEFYYHASQTNARLLAVAAQAGPPAIPACPSVILAINKEGK